jgi:hypothetical protein
VTLLGDAARHLLEGAGPGFGEPGLSEPDFSGDGKTRP